MTRMEAVIEDAEWLAITGESTENATKRLGYTKWGTLHRALTRAGRGDIAARLLRNGERLGHVPQASSESASLVDNVFEDQALREQLAMSDLAADNAYNTTLATPRASGFGW